MMLNASALAAYAQYTLAESFIPELPGRYRGKVRENYDLRDGTHILIATDRISAFDRILSVILHVSGLRRPKTSAATTLSSTPIPTCWSASVCR